jgi:hypothetical protein
MSFAKLFDPIISNHTPSLFLNLKYSYLALMRPSSDFVHAVYKADRRPPLLDLPVETVEVALGEDAAFVGNGHVAVAVPHLQRVANFVVEQ